jgi:hypothetical protein
MRSLPASFASGAPPAQPEVATGFYLADTSTRAFDAQVDAVYKDVRQGCTVSVVTTLRFRTNRRRNAQFDCNTNLQGAHSHQDVKTFLLQIQDAGSSLTDQKLEDVLFAMSDDQGEQIEEVFGDNDVYVRRVCNHT